MTEFRTFYGFVNYQYSLFTPGTGYGFGQHRVDFIQHRALIGTFWKCLLVDAFFAGAFDEIADFEIVFKFEYFFCHFFYKYISMLCTNIDAALIASV